MSDRCERVLRGGGSVRHAGTPWRAARVLEAPLHFQYSKLAMRLR